MASRNFDPARRKSPPRKDPTFRRLEAIVPRDQLVDILGTSDDERYRKLMELLLDPTYRSSTLATIARKADLTYPELLRFITSARLSQGVLRMSEHVPDVLEDVAIDAKSKLVTCPECKGVKEVTVQRGQGKNIEFETVECWVCGGKGKLRKPGDADARALVFETFGLTGKGKAGVTINVGSTGGPSVEDEMERASKVIDQPMIEVTAE